MRPDLRSSVRIHRLSIAQREPAANDPVDGPHTGREENRYRKRDTDEGNKQHRADHAPEEGKPKRPDLPAKVRLEEGPSCLSPLYVVDDHSNDRRHAKNKGADNGCGGRYADEKAQGVQGIHQVSNADERRHRFGGKFGILGH